MIVSICDVDIAKTINKIKIATAINPPITIPLFPKISLSDDLIVEDLLLISKPHPLQKVASSSNFMPQFGQNCINYTFLLNFHRKNTF